MITRLRLINFRNHADSSIYFHPLNLLIGPVGAGKSNAFRGLVFLQNTIHRTLVELFPPGLGEFHWVRSRWADETDPIAFEVELSGVPEKGDQAKYTLKLADSPNGIYVLYEALERRRGDDPWNWVFKRESKPRTIGEFGDVDAYEPTILYRVWQRDSRVRSDARGVRFASAIAKALSRVGYFHLEASDLKTLGTGEPWDRIGYTGGRLPDFIAWAKSSAEARPVFDAILREMTELLPGLKDIVVTQTQTEKLGIAMVFDGYRGFIAAPDLSDGTMFTLGLLCVVNNPRPPSVLCIEEPESGLHPRRLRWLFDHLVQLAYPASDGGAPQIVLSTHSPYLVDLFSEMIDAIQIMEQRDGRSHVSSMSSIRSLLHTESTDGEGIGRLWSTGLFEQL